MPKINEKSDITKIPTIEDLEVAYMTLIAVYETNGLNIETHLKAIEETLLILCDNALRKR